MYQKYTLTSVSIVKCIRVYIVKTFYKSAYEITSLFERSKDRASRDL